MPGKLIDWTLFGVFFAILFTLKWSIILALACVYAALSLTEK
jgi:hypothetical protein